jgi:uncharacterized membrane protein (Fun14 family)
MDLAPFVGTVGGGFLIGFITGYAIKKVINLIGYDIKIISYNIHVCLSMSKTLYKELLIYVIENNVNQKMMIR